MKKIILSAIFATFLLSVVFVSSSFTTKVKTSTASVSSSEIEFTVENNTGSEFDYCVNGGHNYINSGSSKSFSYSEGQEFYYIDNSNCGDLWFKVTSDMAGKTYKVTDLK